MYVRWSSMKYPNLTVDNNKVDLKHALIHICTFREVKPGEHNSNRFINIKKKLFILYTHIQNKFISNIYRHFLTMFSTSPTSEKYFWVLSCIIFHCVHQLGRAFVYLLLDAGQVACTGMIRHKQDKNSEVKTVF